MAAGLGADAVGVNFVGASPRCITPNIAREIVRRLPPEIMVVGIFRDHRKEKVVQIANEVGLRAVQLHGQETPVETRWVADRLPNVIRAFSASDPALDHLEEFGDVQLLLDAPEPGSGKPFDWSLLAQRPPPRPYILAGGLHPDNVADAIALLGPWGVDAASGIERSPSRKDPVLVQRFIATARSMTRSDGTDHHSSLDGSAPGPLYDLEEDTSWR